MKICFNSVHYLGGIPSIAVETRAIWVKLALGGFRAPSRPWHSPNGVPHAQLGSPTRDPFALLPFPSPPFSFDGAGRPSSPAVIRSAQEMESVHSWRPFRAHCARQSCHSGLPIQKWCSRNCEARNTRTRVRDRRTGRRSLRATESELFRGNAPRVCVSFGAPVIEGLSFLAIGGQCAIKSPHSSPEV